MIHPKNIASVLAVSIPATLLGAGCLAQPGIEDTPDHAAAATDGAAVGAQDDGATAEAKQACGGGFGFGDPTGPFGPWSGFAPFNFGPWGFTPWAAGPWGGCGGCGGW